MLANNRTGGGVTLKAASTNSVCAAEKPKFSTCEFMKRIGKLLILFSLKETGRPPRIKCRRTGQSSGARSNGPGDLDGTAPTTVDYGTPGKRRGSIAKSELGGSEEELEDKKRDDGSRKGASREGVNGRSRHRIGPV